MKSFHRKILFLLISHLREMDTSSYNIAYDGTGATGWNDIAEKGFECISDDIMNGWVIEILNSKGVKTQSGKAWNKRRWREVRYAMVASIGKREDITRRDIQSCLEESGVGRTLFTDEVDELGYQQRDYKALQQQNASHTQGISGKMDKIHFARWSSK